MANACHHSAWRVQDHDRDSYFMVVIDLPLRTKTQTGGQAKLVHRFERALQCDLVSHARTNTEIDCSIETNTEESRRCPTGDLVCCDSVLALHPCHFW